MDLQNIFIVLQLYFKKIHKTSSIMIAFEKNVSVTDIMSSVHVVYVSGDAVSKTKPKHKDHMAVYFRHALGQIELIKMEYFENKVNTEAEVITNG